MALLPQTIVHERRYKTARWPNFFLWTLCCIPVLHSYLLLSSATLEALQAPSIQLLRPIGTLGAAGILFYTAWLARGHRRLAWMCHAVALCCAALFSSLKIIEGATIAAWPMRALWVGIYLFSFAGTALYLQQRSWWLGSTWRIIIAGLGIGISALVLMQTMLPNVIPLWPWTPQASIVTPSLAFDIGIIFAFAVVGLRYKQSSGPIIPYVLLCLLCLLIADSFFFVLSWAPWGRQLQFVPMPLYTLHSILLALAAYRDITYIPIDSGSQPSTMPLTEWLLWVLVPLMVMIAAFTAAGFLGTVSPLLIVALAIITIVHEVLAMFDYRRVILALHKARLASADLAAERERNHIAREIHDGLGHYFTGIGAQLQATQVLLDVKRERALNALGKAQRLADEGLDEVRRSISTLRENPLGTRPVHEALANLLDTAKVAGLATQFDLYGTARPLQDDVALTLYRIAQEAISNTLKHAQALSIHIMLDYRLANHVTLTILDDGQGAETIEGGFGLIGMRERIEILGGAMQVHTAPGQGCTINVEVPA